MNARGLAMACAALLCGLGGAPRADAQDAAALRTRHVELSESLASNPFRRPLHLESAQLAGEVKGEIHARTDHPFAVVGPALRDMDHWCDILILHLNVKQCRSSRSTLSDLISVHIGRKFDQPLADAYLFRFQYQVATAAPDYFRVVLSAADGPLGTRDYRIVLEAVQLDAGRSFLHLSYSYAQGAAAGLATRVYLATIGRSKVGFSIVGRDGDGKPVYVASTRGVVERNTMRIYLAIEAYLGALSVPAPARSTKRLADWFASVERYPVQLHELEREQYLDMKRREIRRQRSDGVTAAP